MANPRCWLVISAFLIWCGGGVAQVAVTNNSCSTQIRAFPPGLYAAPDGSDANPGTAELPLKTLPAAQSIVRSRVDKPTVYLLSGVYELKEQLTLTSEDSGLTVRGYDTCGASVISGGRSISGWTKLSDWLWTAPVDFVFHQLFIDRRRMERARTQAFMRVDGSVDNHEPINLHFHSEDISPDWVGADLIFLQLWVESRLPIRRGDSQNHIVVLANSMVPWMVEPNARYYVENAPGLLRYQGQWYLDENSKRVLYIPHQGEDISKESIVGSNLQTLISIQGAKNVTLSGLTFAYTDWKVSADGYVNRQTGFDLRGAIEGNSAENISLTNDRFEHLGENSARF